MAQLVSLIVSDDDTFRKQIGRLLRSGTVPVSVVEDGTLRDGTPPRSSSSMHAATPRRP